MIAKLYSDLFSQITKEYVGHGGITVSANMMTPQIHDVFHLPITLTFNSRIYVRTYLC